MVVTAARGREEEDQAAASLTVLTREEIARLPARTLGELLRYLPGMPTLFGAAYAGPVPMPGSRGFFGGGEAEYLQLRVDGVPVYDVESGLGEWRRLRADTIERIEAVRGPGSPLYGDSALGGVVHVFTRRAEGFTASASAGSFGSAEADASYGLQGTVWSGAVSGSATTTEGFRAHGTARSAGGGATLARALGDGTLRLDLTYAYQDAEDPGPLPQAEALADPRRSDAAFRVDRDAASRARAVLSYLVEDVAVRVFGAVRDGVRTRTLALAPGLTDSSRRELTTSTAGASLEGESRALGERTRLRAALDTSYETLDSRDHDVNGDGAPGPLRAASTAERLRLALLVAVDHRLAGPLRVLASLRFDEVRDSSSATTGDSGSARHRALSPRLALQYASGATSLHASAARAFQAPTLDQLFDPHPIRTPFGEVRLANRSLTPQRATALEVGAAHRRETLAARAALYRTDVDDEIDFDARTFSYRNIGRSRHQGLEAEASLSPRGWPLSPFVSYTLTQVTARDGADAGRQLKNIPRHLLRSGCSARLPLGFEAEAIATRLAGRFADDAERHPLEDVWQADLRISRGFGDVRASLDLLNLTGARSSEVGYVLTDLTTFRPAVYTYPAPGFAARLTLALRP